MERQVETAPEEIRLRQIGVTTRTFSYASLNKRRSEIRLLKPKKRTAPAGNQTLSFELVKLSLDSVIRKQYYAVSYTWGEFLRQMSLSS